MNRVHIFHSRVYILYSCSVSKTGFVISSKRLDTETGLLQALVSSVQQTMFKTKQLILKQSIDT